MVIRREQTPFVVGSSPSPDPPPNLATGALSLSLAWNGGEGPVRLPLSDLRSRL